MTRRMRAKLARGRRLQSRFVGGTRLPHSGDSSHVDVVKNEWLAGYQVVVARLSATSDGLDVDARSPWDEMIESYREGTDAQTFLASLHERLKGDYVFATEPHSSDDCPFHEMVVPMKVLEPDHQAAEQAVHRHA